MTSVQLKFDDLSRRLSGYHSLPLHYILHCMTCTKEDLKTRPNLFLANRIIYLCELGDPYSVRGSNLE